MNLERLYFAYGSNMCSERLRARIPDVEPVGRARWPGMRLAFNKIGVDGSGKANLIPDPVSVAWGVVFRIPAAAWTILDGFEPGYVRSACALLVDGDQPTSADVYLGKGPLRHTPPHDWYREHLLRGAIEHALPEDIVRLIREL